MCSGCQRYFKDDQTLSEKGRGEEEEFMKMTSGTSAGYLPETRDEENNNNI